MSSWSVRPASDVFPQRHPARQRSVDVSVRVGRNALLRAVRSVRNERGDLAVAHAADTDAPGEAGIRLLVGLGIGHVDCVVAIDEDAARPPELLPLLEITAVLVEDLDAVV